MQRKIAAFNLLLLSLLAFKEVEKKVVQTLELTQVNSYVLEIPKISLKKPFYPNDEKKNTLNYGIETKINHSMLLLSHSGNGAFSYFNRLEELTIEDEFFIYHAGKCYRYLITEQHYKEKDGTLKRQVQPEDTVLLLTCSKKYKEKQVYFVGTKM